MAEKVGDAYVELGTRDAKLNKGLNRAKSKVGGFSAGAVVALGSVVALTAAMKKLLDLSFAQEDAEKGLESALIANGDAYEELLPKLKKAASAIQQLSKFGDEANLQTMTSLRNLGVQANALGAATKQAIGLAEALGLDSSAAAKYTALARQGEFTILQRYVPALREATTQAEKQAIVTDLMNKGWEQAQRNATTTSGAVTQLGNAFGDLGETIGDLISGEGMGGALIELKILVEDLDEALKSLQGSAVGGAFKDFFGGFPDDLRIVSGFLGALASGSSVNEAADIAKKQEIESRRDREGRRRREIDKIKAELTGGDAAAGDKGKAAKRRAPGFSFTSPEQAIKTIQSSLGKDNEQKKQTNLLGNIDKGIQEIVKKPEAAVVGV